MAKRIRIAIPFSSNDNWVAGAYYITNLIYSLKLLDDKIRPELLILSVEKKDIEIVKKIGYANIKYLSLTIEYNVLERIVNKISRIILSKNVIDKFYGENDFDILYPHGYYYSIRDTKCKLYWIPDFQDRYFPELFSEQEREDRRVAQNRMADSNSCIVFSSENARNDFYRFYPDNKCKTFVLHFACTHPEYNSLDINGVKEKFNISGDYFISPNQFWKHKNHMVVLKAIKLLKERNTNITVAFTGKEQDYRNPDYFSQLKRFVEENNLQEQVRFLGFIDRNEQLRLMRSAIAVIQPSLFEGWSTVVEDAKEMNQYVILSDIAVHHEQLEYNVSFFDPQNESDLADKIIDVLMGNILKTSKDYRMNVRKFGEDFMKVVSEVVRL